MLYLNRLWNWQTESHIDRESSFLTIPTESSNSSIDCVTNVESVAEDCSNLTTNVSRCIEAQEHFNTTLEEMELIETKFDSIDDDPMFEIDNDYIEQGQLLLVNTPVKGFIPGILTAACMGRIARIVANAEKISDWRGNTMDFNFSSSNEIGGNVFKADFNAVASK